MSSKPPILVGSGAGAAGFFAAQGGAALAAGVAGAAVRAVAVPLVAAVGAADAALIAE